MISRTLPVLGGLLLGGCSGPYPDYWDKPSAFPELTAVSPDSTQGMAGGEEIVLEGARLGTTRTVVIGGRNAEIVEATDSSVTVTLPDSAPGGGIADIAVVTDDGYTMLEEGFRYVVEGDCGENCDADEWWSDEVSSVVLSRIDCPVSAWGYLASMGYIVDMWWCGLEVGYAEAYGFAGASPQPGMAGDLGSYAAVSDLPPIGDTRVLGPTDRRPPTLPVIYGPHSEDEAIAVTTARDFERDLDFLEERHDIVQDTYYWYEDVTDVELPLVWMFDDEQCYEGEVSVTGADGDELFVDQSDLDATGLWLGYSITETYSPTEKYETEGVTSTAMVTSSRDGFRGEPSGATLNYDSYSGYFWPEGVADSLYGGDLPPDATYTVSYSSLGETQLTETTRLGEVEGVQELVVTYPDLLAGDAYLSRDAIEEIFWVPASGTSEDPSFISIDIRIFDAGIDDPNWMTEVYRLTARGDDSEGTLRLGPAVLGQLPEALNEFDDNYDQVGLWGEMTVARHQLRKVPTDDGDLVVDFVHVVNAPISL
ncbi:MAG: IPT/TIG domain-containing protein, partial [Myxococcota bacterium]|nr:IPT/TIG domain-containing protein [Myxococcota bacterium]